MAGSAIEFVLSLVDRISAPAKAASVQLSALETQLKSVQSLLKEMPGLKLPKLGGTLPGMPRAKNSPMFGPAERAREQFGPSRKDAERAAKYREQQAVKAARESQRIALSQAKAADALDKQRSKSLYAEMQKQERLQLAQAKQAERAAKLAARASEREQLRQTKSAQREQEKASALAARQAKAAARIQEEVSDPGGFVSKFQNLGKSFTVLTGITPGVAAGIAGVGAAAVAAAVAVYKLGSAVLDLVISGASLAIEASDAKGDALDMYEAMLGSAEAAERTLSAVRDITRNTTASQGAVEASAQALTAAGVTNEKLLQDSVRSIAQVDSVLKGYGGKIEGIIEKAAQTGKFELNPKKLLGTGVQVKKLYEELAKRTGVGVKQVEAQLKAGKIKAEVGIAALTKVIDDKFGAVAAKQAKDFPVQLQRFKDSIGRLFEDVDTQPFLDALDRIVSLFDGNTQAGAAMKTVITDVFNGIFAAITRVEPYVRVFLKGLVIIGLQIAIALKPVTKSLREAFGGESQSGPMRLAEVMSLVGLGLRTIITWAIKAAPVLSAIWSVASLVGGAMLSLATTLTVGVPLAIARLIGAIVMAVGWFTQFGDRAIEAGGNLVSGLITGIKNAAGSLYATVTDMAKNALASFTDFFSIHSDSRVMMKMGGHLVGGLGTGIRAGAQASSGAMVGAGAGLASHAAVGASAGLMSFAGPQLGVSSMLGQRHITGNDNGYTPRSEPARLAPARESRQGSTVIVHPGAFAEGSIVMPSGLSAEEVREMFPEMMADAWERVALSNGTGG